MNIGPIIKIRFTRMQSCLCYKRDCNFRLYLFAFVGEPASDGYCAESHDETEWHSHLCSQIDSFICEDRLNLAQEEKTWEEALQHCR